MGKNHASQYANFGSLRDYELSKMFCRTEMFYYALVTAKSSWIVVLYYN